MLGSPLLQHSGFLSSTPVHRRHPIFTDINEIRPDFSFVSNNPIATVFHFNRESRFEPGTIKELSSNDDRIFSDELGDLLKILEKAPLDSSSILHVLSLLFIKVSLTFEINFQHQ